MRILPTLAVVLLLTGASTPLRADVAPSPEALTAANELFTILSGDVMKQLTGQLTGAFWPGVAAQARAAKIDDATIAEMRTAFERIQLAFVINALKEAPPIYARHFTGAELRELTAFYRTPTGAKALHEMPQVMGEFTALLVPQLKDVQERTNAAFDKILKAHGYVK